MRLQELIKECCPIVFNADYKRLQKKYSMDSIPRPNNVPFIPPAVLPSDPAATLPVADYLYIILPYFNYCFFERRKQLFQEFIARISKHPKLRIVVAEAIERGEEGQLKPQDVPNTLLHLKIETQHRIWLKENLINIAVGYLPQEWKAMAWIDADLTFLNPNWVEDTFAALETWDVVQLFEQCHFLGPDGNPLKTDKGFGFMSQTSGKPYTKTHKYGFWHPGFAWGCTRRAYEAMGGLIDWGILGSGDHHMALALIGKVDISHPPKIHPVYIQQLKAFQARVQQHSLQLGYVKGTLQHHWHGRLEDRKYQERWTILTKYAYNPEEDLYKTPSGLFQLTLKGLRLREDIHAYFEGRQEDRKEK
jgi:hypothetical protein